MTQSDGDVLDPMSKDEGADDVAVARFLRTCPGLSKSIIGDMLGQPNQRCLQVLDAFTHMFDFSGGAPAVDHHRAACPACLTWGRRKDHLHRAGLAAPLPCAVSCPSPGPCAHRHRLTLCGL